MDEPLEIVEARAVLQRVGRGRSAFLLVPMALVASVLAAVGVGLEELAIPLTIGIFVSTGGLAAWLSSQGDAARAARKRIDAWEGRQPEVEDPQVAATRALIRRIAELGRDLDGIDSIAARSEDRLRGLVEDLRLLDQAVEADRAVAEEGGAALRAARDRKDAELRALVGSLRDLHAGLAVRQAGGDPVEADLGEIVRKLEAEAEVESIDRRRELGIAQARRNRTTADQR